MLLPTLPSPVHMQAKVAIPAPTCAADCGKSPPCAPSSPQHSPPPPASCDRRWTGKQAKRSGRERAVGMRCSQRRARCTATAPDSIAACSISLRACRPCLLCCSQHSKRRRHRIHGNHPNTAPNSLALLLLLVSLALRELSAVGRGDKLLLVSIQVILCRKGGSRNWQG